MGRVKMGARVISNKSVYEELKKRKILKTLCLLGFVLAYLSCGPKYVYKWIEVNPPFDSSFIKKIAVFEFSNQSGDPSAGIMISDKIEQLLVKNSGYEVINRMNIDRILAEHDLSVQGILESSTINKIGKITGVDAIVVGNVSKYSLKLNSWQKDYGLFKSWRYKKTAIVEFSFKVLNTITGQVVWADNCSGSYWRECGENTYPEYLDELSDPDYISLAIKEASNKAWYIFPHKRKTRVLAENDQKNK